MNGKGFNVSLRTVQRDLHALASAIPELENDENKDMIGWYWREDAPPMNLPSLDPALAMAFRLSESFLKPQLPEAVLKPLEPYFRVANNVLVESDQDQYRDWPNKVKFLPKGQPLLPPKISVEIFKTIQNALFENKKFKGLYKSPRKDMAEYEFNPLALVYRGQVIYLLATLWDFNDIRQFAIHRFKEAWSMETQTHEINGFDLETYVSEGNFDWAYGEEIILVGHFHEFAVRILEETPLSGDQTIVPLDDEPEWFTVSATVKNTEQLRWWLMEWGDNVEVIEPNSLRGSITENVSNLNDYYS